MNVADAALRWIEEEVLETGLVLAAWTEAKLLVTDCPFLHVNLSMNLEGETREDIGRMILQG